MLLFCLVALNLLLRRLDDTKTATGEGWLHAGLDATILGIRILDRSGGPFSYMGLAQVTFSA